MSHSGLDFRQTPLQARTKFERDVRDEYSHFVHHRLGACKSTILGKDMASLAAALRGVPARAKAVIAKQLVGQSLEKLGAIRVFPKGIPFPDEWIISVLPSSAGNAKRIIDALVKRPAIGHFEVFPYGIVNPEIGRIDISVGPQGR